MYKYTHLIRENIAPIGAKSIGVYDSNGKRVGGFGLGRLKPPTAPILYNFLAISDVHITYDTANADFQRALEYAEANCDFTCICGDLTDNGTASQLAQYKSIVDTYAKTKPVYAMAGNHENHDLRNIIEQYTGYPLYYSFTQGNDVFIMVGHAGGYRASNWERGEQFTHDELQWLYETLEANRNKRCFVFCHVFPHKDGVGNANGSYTNDIWTSTEGTVFENLMKHYKNTVLFHGHSHFKFELQEVDKKANYSSAVIFHRDSVNYTVFIIIQPLAVIDFAIGGIGGNIEVKHTYDLIVFHYRVTCFFGDVSLDKLASRMRCAPLVSVAVITHKLARRGVYFHYLPDLFGAYVTYLHTYPLFALCAMRRGKFCGAS